jgi:cell division protein FtsB
MARQQTARALQASQELATAKKEVDRLNKEVDRLKAQMAPLLEEHSRSDWQLVGHGECPAPRNTPVGSPAKSGHPTHPTHPTQ